MPGCCCSVQHGPGGFEAARTRGRQHMPLFVQGWLHGAQEQGHAGHGWPRQSVRSDGSGQRSLLAALARGTEYPLHIPPRIPISIFHPIPPPHPHPPPTPTQESPPLFGFFRVYFWFFLGLGFGAPLAEHILLPLPPSPRCPAQLTEHKGGQLLGGDGAGEGRGAAHQQRGYAREVVEPVVGGDVGGIGHRLRLAMKEGRAGGALQRFAAPLRRRLRL